MKVTFWGIAALTAVSCLAACATPSASLEEAEARCTQKGGMLAVIYTQEVTASGVGRRVGRPGECLSPGKFGAAGAGAEK